MTAQLGMSSISIMNNEKEESNQWNMDVKTQDGTIRYGPMSNGLKNIIQK